MSSWTDQEIEQACRECIPGYNPWACSDEFYFDIAAARKIIDFATEVCTFTNSKWAGQRVVLTRWQVGLFGNLFGWRRRNDGLRRYRKALLFAAKKIGKALALDTPIPTPNGWSTMGELKIGDKIFDENGLPCTVTYATEVMLGRECFNVQFSDGESIVADADHQWAVQSRAPAKIQVLTTREIAATCIIPARTTFRNHSVLVNDSLQLPLANLLIDPYVLGVWLGNGTSQNASITFHEDDKEVMQQISAAGYEIDAPNNRCGKGITCWVGKGKHRGGSSDVPFQAKLRQLGLLRNKHIPLPYLRGSESQRLRLLQGLMDTDGSITERGASEFCSCSRLLADDVVHLIRSLGIKATIKESPAKINGRVVGARYRIHFFSFADRPVFSLQRKVKRLRRAPQRRTRCRTKQITAVTPVESVPVRCIQVDSPSHLYLAGRQFTPTHNTELAAIIANYLLFCDGEPAPEIVSAAGNAEQATKVFSAASKMVLAEPELKRRAEVLTKSIRHLTNGGNYKVINAAAKTKHGGNIQAALIDELWVMDAELVDALETSTRTRSQPLILYTTTAGENPESIAGEVYDYAVKIRDGIHTDDEFLPVIFEAPKDADPGDPAVWRMAQPNLGVTVPESEYAKDYAAALKVPRKMATFRQFSLNQWTESAASWVPLEDWRKCGAEFTLDLFKGKRATLGIDLSSTVDTSAVVTCIDADGMDHVWADIFIPEDNAEGRFIRQKRDRAPYLTWVKQGHMHATPGNTIDYAAIENRILELSAMFDIAEIQADPYNASGLLERLMKHGLKVVTVRQGWTLAEATKETERRILAGELRHPNNPAFNFQVSSAACKHDERDNQWITKSRSTARVDAAVAMVMAINAAHFSNRDAVDDDDPSGPWEGDVFFVEG